MKYIIYLCSALLAIALWRCTDDALDPPRPAEGDGTLLNLYIGSIGTPGTRLAELGNTGNISGGVNPTHGDPKGDIGLYIYYQDDYSGGDLTKPYVRNLRCKVEGGRIKPVDNASIYIYDRMTIVAFYPYNDAADDYTFTVKKDEKKYSITESDYSYQYYIPYRAQVNVNPTTAYYVNLDLDPVQTVKIQVVLTASDESLFPEETDGQEGNVKLVPEIDPVKVIASGDTREYWVDLPEQNFPGPNPRSSGQYVRRYNAYIWKNNDSTDLHHGGGTNHYDNTLKKGEILLQSDNLTLFFPEDVDIRESHVYRYGYNIDTGEIFIPTSETLIYDAATLAAGRGGYQVCDINLTDVPEWIPVDLTGTYDGGGHAVKNMKITTAPADGNIGLFGSLAGGTLVKNLHLEKPEITIEADDVTVGGLVGQFNRELTSGEIEALIAAEFLHFPAGLPQTVIDALIAERMREYKANSTSLIQGCKVSDPTISVTGENVIVGGFVGTVGQSAAFKGNVKDSYVSGGSISVNAGDKTKFNNARVGAFAGLLQYGSIVNSYTTALAEAYIKETTGTPPETSPKEVAKGFANVSATPEVTDCFTTDLKENTEPGVTEFIPDWPGWGTYGGKWPVANSSLGNYWGDMGGSPPKYPTLAWETLLDIKK